MTTLKSKRSETEQGEMKKLIECMENVQKCKNFNSKIMPMCLRKIRNLLMKDKKNGSACAYLEKIYYEKQILNILKREYSEEASEIIANYKHIANYCLQNNEEKLALQYMGQSAALSCKNYGEKCERSRYLLDEFAKIYSLIGRSNYEETVKKHEKLNKPNKHEMDEIPGSKCYLYIQLSVVFVFMGVLYNLLLINKY
ncbi:hypothetical protein A3Q56_07869 [Intoshia linei]|uniref:Uncharacterized protein n=1 Tax=Intoshia linei TaxID=1819745 RepID=A0A177ASQ1_9BILA|nr:hypothetical protein A3Q56_07869 [Intoshia linei]